MMDAMITRIVRFFERWMPDALIVAVLLTLLTFVLSWLLTPSSAHELITGWGDGFWALLTFTNQITLTLLLGYVLATTRPVHAALVRCAALARTPRMAYVWVCVLVGLLALLSWSTALVAAGILSRAVAEGCRDRGVRVHYPLLVASAFSGFVIWHQGLSSSIALTIATPGHFLEAQIGVIPTSETLFTTWNLVSFLAILVTLPWMMSMLHPRRPEDVVELAPDLPEAPVATLAGPPETPAGRLERSRLLAVILLIGMGVFLFTHYGVRGDGLTLNIMNFTLLTLAILFSGNLHRFGQLASSGGHIVIPFLLQYPFYAGIVGMVGSSGLGAMIVNGIISVATVETLPLFGFLSGGLLNVFIPSGGGQWAVQGPIMMSAAQALDADLALTAMAVAMGDQWTNLIQPLILLPALTLARIPVRAVMGYLFIALLWTGLVFIGVMLLA